MVASDSRYRTKLYLDTYITAANLKEDDGSTNASFVVMYAYPDYPLSEEFSSNLIDCVFCVGKPDSKALLNSQHYAYGYVENVPITLWTTDKTGITGVKMMWKMETELRRIIETYPLGSVRTIDKMRENTERLGSTTLYSSEYVMNYTRDTTT